LARRISSFTDPLPSTLYWDASFVVNFAYEAARYFQQCAEFLTRLEDASVISYVSTLALDEACFVLLQLKVEEDREPTKFWNVYNADPSVIEPFLPRDAYHLATMRHYGLDSIVTLDADFLPIPDIRIFTCAPAILRQAVKGETS
jgi:predicted nucleic acid-binding protein